MNQKEQDMEHELDEDAVPLCLHCLEPVNPLDMVCPNCNGAVGQLTPYMPWQSIRWSAGIWGKMWEQIWRSDLSIISRVFRFMIIVWCVPILLVGLIPMIWHKCRQAKN